MASRFEPVRSALCTAMLCFLVFAPAARALAQQDVELQEEQAIQAAVERIVPSVVRIETFGGLEKVGNLLVGSGPTTGLVVSEEGYIVSSAFNFVGQPTSILVTLSGENRAAAKIVARDHARMLVLLKVNTDKKLTVPQAVPRSQMVVGQWAIAVGRTYEGSGANVSVGILSATHRIWSKAIQTDAKISPNNYGGPLIDIAGRVLGVLVPLSPQGQGEVAGAEWYDSGIGFAVPLEDIFAKLDQLKSGKDLHPGILGVTLKGKDVYSDPAIIAAAQGNSPAALAGLRAGDKIVEVDGQKIVRQAQLKHMLGPRYAGETVKIVALRGEERIEAAIELTDKLDPYQHPFLGVLPMRDADRETGGVVVRYVYPGSPAAEAGIEAGDRLVKMGDKAIPDAGSMQEMLATVDPKAKLKLEVKHGQEMRTVEISLGTLPVDIPASLPAARAARPPVAEGRPAVGSVEVKLPEERNECIAYIPESYDPDVPYGVVVWLHAPGGFDKDKLLARWKDLCEKNDVILLAPLSAKKDAWERTEIDFVKKALENLLGTYNVDRTRIVLHGYQGGAAMAYLVAFAHPESFRAVAAVDAAIPRGVKPPENDPIYRLAFYSAQGKSDSSEQITAGIKALENLKFPVTVKDLGGAARYLNDAELAELIRWIDTLDRI